MRIRSAPLATFAAVRITTDSPTAASSKPISEVALAECYRLTGADPNGASDTVLATFATAEVRRLRFDHDALEGEVDKLRDAIRQHRRNRSTPDSVDAELYAALDPIVELLAEPS